MKNLYGGRCPLCGLWVLPETGEVYNGRAYHVGRCPDRLEHAQEMADYKPPERNITYGEPGEWWEIRYSHLLGCEKVHYHFGDFYVIGDTVEICRKKRKEQEDK